MPSQLTAAEVATVKDMVLAPEYRHMPLRTLSLYAQRIGKVFTSVLVPAEQRPAITVMADSGVENVNAAVDAILLTERLHRVLAQVEVTESNSMIEAWWRSLKHQWLYLNSLDTIEHLRSLVAFFVEEHNTKMPHAAFRGHTPDEVYFGTAPNLPTELADSRNKARGARLASNRNASCGRCTTVPEPSHAREISP